MSSVYPSPDSFSRLARPANKSVSVESGRSEAFTDQHLPDEIHALSGILEILSRRKWIVLICVFGLTLVSVIVSSLLPKSYTAESIVMLDTRHPAIEQTLTQANLVSGSMSDSAIMRSEVTLLSSPAYARKVIERLNLLHNPIFYTEITADGWRSRVRGSVEEAFVWLASSVEPWIGKSEVAASPAPKISREQKLLESGIVFFGQNLNVFNDDRSYIIKLRYESTDPVFAADVVNTLAQIYVEDQLKFKQDQTRVALKWLTRQIDEQGNKVRSDEHEVTDFEQQHHLQTVLNGSIVEQRMNDLNAQLAAAIADRIQKEASLKQLQPSQVAAIQINVAKMREQAFEVQIRNLQTELDGMNTSRVQLIELQRKTAIERKLYESFLERSQQIESEAQSQQPDARFLPGEVPIKPSFPNKVLLSGMGFCISLVVGIWLAILIDRLDKTIRTPADAARVTGAPTIGVVPRVHGERRALAALIDNPSSTYSEAINRVLMAIQFDNHQSSHKVVMVTSALAGEGKSLVAASLARTAAARGIRTLLVDCDLRRPAIPRLLGSTEGHSLTGMFEQNQTSTRDAVTKQEDSGLHYLPVGKAYPSPQKILGSSWMASFVSRAREDYDLVVLDTPPLLAIWDALILSQTADATLMTIRWGKTPQRAVRDAVRLLHDYGVQPMGTVLSLVEWKKYSKYSKGDLYYTKMMSRELLTNSAY